MTIAFPPLLTGLVVAGDPFEAACAGANAVEAGSVFYSLDHMTLRSAVVLAPEMSLSDAVTVSFAVSLGLNDAVGALAPPEVAFHLEWPGTFRVNGAVCGGMRMRASTPALEAEPDWIVIGVSVPVAGDLGAEPGVTPDVTCLHAEGCGELTTPVLLEAWAHHMMNWLHIFLTEGFQPLHSAWASRAYQIGQQIERPKSGCFIGLDDKGGMILKAKDSTRILPLTDMLETR
ncbi:MAG: DUF4444 domain-containing protein [Pseudomonadota bacterium]